MSLLIILFWAVCSILVYGMSFAYYCSNFSEVIKNGTDKYVECRNFCLLMSLGGPLSVVSWLLHLVTTPRSMHRYCGFKFK